MLQAAAIFQSVRLTVWCDEQSQSGCQCWRVTSRSRN